MHQTQTFLQAVGSTLAIGQGASIDIQGIGDGKIKLIYSPKIGETPEGASSEVVALRADIAVPFVVTGTAVEIEEAFAARLREKSAVVTRGMSALDEIERLANAAKAAVKPAQGGTAAPVAGEPADDLDDEGDSAVTSAEQNSAGGVVTDSAPASGSIGERF